MYTDVQLETKPCPMGCPDTDQFLFNCRDRIYHLEGAFSIVKCRSCGLIRTNPRPTADTIGYYYPDCYGPHIGTIIQNKDGAPTGGKAKIRELAKKIFRTNANYIPDLPPGRMLEIGCASGSYLQKMEQLGWDVAGIESSAQASARALQNGFQVYHGSLESAPAPEAPYDLIVGWMVLEHLHDPVQALEKLYAWSSTAAQLVLSVPNAASFEFKRFKERWYALQAPTHLYHYTPDSIKALLSQSNWQVQKIYHQRSIANLIASCGYWLEDSGKFSNLASAMERFPEAAPWCHAIFYPLAYILSHFGQTGRMTIWARKKH